MKKLILMIMCTALIFSATGCGYNIVLEAEPKENTSPSVFQEVVFDDMKFVLYSPHEQYDVSTIDDVENPFYFQLIAEYVGDEDFITLTGGMAISSVNLYDSNGMLSVWSQVFRWHLKAMC